MVNHHTQSLRVAASVQKLQGVTCHHHSPDFALLIDWDACEKVNCDGNVDGKVLRLCAICRKEPFCTCEQCTSQNRAVCVTKPLLSSNDDCRATVKKGLVCEVCSYKWRCASLGINTDKQ
jgi:hypothetical protein